jgi:hypothetical protein
MRLKGKKEGKCEKQCSRTLQRFEIESDGRASEGGIKAICFSSVISGGILTSGKKVNNAWRVRTMISFEVEWLGSREKQMGGKTAAN